MSCLGDFDNQSMVWVGEFEDQIVLRLSISQTLAISNIDFFLNMYDPFYIQCLFFYNIRALSEFHWWHCQVPKLIKKKLFLSSFWNFLSYYINNHNA